ncbi:hypothetical protein [Gordonia zhaorongruii]|uniref:hypothetical protein n=1 Tax=Gordonia zhaorongruii TaxID=2597659 RepID=UPI001FD3561F|nr:hypothetical protein [Gordonia zhaorongruii]
MIEGADDYDDRRYFIRFGRGASLVAFAARSDAYEGLIMWHRYEAMYRALDSTMREAAATEASGDAGDVYTRVCDPVCQVAGLYAHAVGCRQFTAELFVDRAGGPTCVCNLNPKCRFHHGLKPAGTGRASAAVQPLRRTRPSGRRLALRRSTATE